MLGASMLTLGSCTDLSETIYSEIASEQYEFPKVTTRASLLRYILLCVTFTGHGMAMRTWTSVQTYGVFPCALV